MAADASVYDALAAAKSRSAAAWPALARVMPTLEAQVELTAINLAARRDRWEGLLRQCARQGVRLRRFEAVDGSAPLPSSDAALKWDSTLSTPATTASA
jgi:hypothetical protein